MAGFFWGDSVVSMSRMEWTTGINDYQTIDWLLVRAFWRYVPIDPSKGVNFQTRQGLFLVGFLGLKFQTWLEVSRCKISMLLRWSVGAHWHSLERLWWKKGCVACEKRSIGTHWNTEICIEFVMYPIHWKSIWYYSMNYVANLGIYGFPLSIFVSYRAPSWFFPSIRGASSKALCLSRCFGRLALTYGALYLKPSTLYNLGLLDKLGWSISLASRVSRDESLDGELVQGSTPAILGRWDMELPGGFPHYPWYCAASWPTKTAKVMAPIGCYCVWLEASSWNLLTKNDVNML